MQVLSLRLVWLLLLSFCSSAIAAKHFHHFKIDYANYTVNCTTKAIVAVNGRSPGPTIRVRRGDRVVIKVTNLVTSNLTIHWHGVHQMLSGWSDGPAFVTQCPIQTNKSYTYNFTVPDQQGTLFWHAHITWLRATVYGAFIIDPPAGAKLPFKKPDGEHTLLLGEWWNEDVEKVENDATVSGLAAVLSNAYLINGHPGPFFNCSTKKDTEIVEVVKGERYLLRVINNALEVDLFVTIAKHSLTVVETDASYTKHITNSSFLISPGQTYTFMIHASQGVGQYYIVVNPFERSARAGVQETPAVAILRYKGAKTSATPVYPSNVPLKNDSTYFKTSQEKVKSLNSKAYPSKVPQTVDVNLLYAVTLNLNPCTLTNTSLCQAIPYTDSATNTTVLTNFASSINNVTFQRSDIALLQAYYHKIDGVYTTDFPAFPPTVYNFTGVSLNFDSLASNKGTKVTVLPYGANVQLVIQGTINLQPEAHPFHLHGTDFFVVGYGDGNYNSSSDPAKFNLVDPAKRNTAMLTKSGWTALRWKAENPGVWLMHCHFDGHVSWGMETVFIVRDGTKPDEILPGPPADLPKC